MSPSRRSKLDLEKLRASIDVICPNCGSRIPPERQLRVNWDHLKCPGCGEAFVPSRREEGSS